MIEAPVLKRTARRLEIVEPADFTLGAGHPIAALPPEATPYCADFERRALLCVTTPDILDHPFLYQAQREQARTVVRIPYAELPGEDVTPVLIFSQGRCGSTLLFRILKAAGLPSVSEPDYPRQIGYSFLNHKFPARKVCQRLLRSATAILARNLGTGSPVVKLHMLCNVAPLLITQAFSSVKVIFILREHGDWALSLKRVVPTLSEQDMVRSLTSALRALDRLAQVHDVRVCHYRDIAQPQAGYVRDLVSFLGREADIPAELLQVVASRDSQEGTPVARAKLGAERVDPRFLEEFERLWEADKPADVIERRGLAGRV